MQMLTVNGEQTTLSLTTLGKQNSATECRVQSLQAGSVRLEHTELR